MSRTVAIVQSNYIPWKGYFDLINSVDEFIFLDNAQYTKRDWRNRNKIKTKDGLRWLTIPVLVKSKYNQAIHDTSTVGNDWRRNHWQNITHAYAKARCFSSYKEQLESLYLGSTATNLSQINHEFTRAICEILGIDTVLSSSTDYNPTGIKDEQLITLCQQSNATSYISGPLARNYIDPANFRAANIELNYIDYSGYPEYEQLYPPFEHGVSVIDLIMNQGPDSSSYLKSFQPDSMATLDSSQ